MRVISLKKLRSFWQDPRNANAEVPLRAWYRVVRHADWKNFADVKATYNATDQTGNKVIFDVGGNKFRLIAVIDYERHKLFVRHVLTHKEYETGNWKKDTFGTDWGRAGQPRGQTARARPRKKKR